MWGKIIIPMYTIGYDYMAYMDYMDPDVLCPQKRLINLISLSLFMPWIKWWFS